MKAEGHLGRCYLKGRAGDADNVILSGVGHKLPPHPRLAQRTLEPVPSTAIANARNSNPAQSGFLTDD